MACPAWEGATVGCASPWIQLSRMRWEEGGLNRTKPRGVGCCVPFVSSTQLNWIAGSFCVVFVSDPWCVLYNVLAYPRRDRRLVKLLDVPGKLIRGKFCGRCPADSRQNTVLFSCTLVGVFSAVSSRLEAISCHFMSMSQVHVERPKPGGPALRNRLYWTEWLDRCSSRT